MKNPWIGVSLVVLGLASLVVFSRLHIAEGEIAIAVITAGIAYLNGLGHETTKRELTTLRMSLRPGPGDPSIRPTYPAPDPAVPFPREPSTGTWKLPPTNGKDGKS